MSVMDIERAKNKYEGKLLRKVRLDNNRIPLVTLWLTERNQKLWNSGALAIEPSDLEEVDEIYTDEIVLCLSICDKNGNCNMACVSPRGQRGFATFSGLMWEVVKGQ